MNDDAYDISHLLELDGFQPERFAKPAPNAPMPSPAIETVATTQEATARELLEASDAHEEMIRQFVAISRQTKRVNPLG